MISARKRIWGWYFFDWASQPYNTLLLTFIFGPYFAEVARGYFAAHGADPTQAAADSQAYWTGAQTITGLIIAFLSPVLGAISDGSGRRMLWIWLFSVMYVAGSFALWYTLPRDAGAVLAGPVVLAGLHRHGDGDELHQRASADLAGQDQMGKISGAGFAFGYAGGVLALFIMLLFLAESGDTGKTLIGLSPAFGLDPALREGTRAVGPFTAIWYVVFMIPFVLWVRETPRKARGRSVGESLGVLWQSILDLKARRSLAAFLLGSMFYRDSLNAVYGLGGAYASNVMGWSVTQSGIFGILAAITAAVASWLGGKLDARFGPKPVISVSVVVLIGVVAVMVGLTPGSIFGVPCRKDRPCPTSSSDACGCLIGAAGGTVQAASRTLMVYHVTPENAASGFGLYGLSGKATAFLAPAMITLATLASGNARIGISPLIALFLVGLVLLIWVNPKGERT